MLVATLTYVSSLTGATTGIDPRNSKYPWLTNLWVYSNNTWTCSYPACLRLVPVSAGSAKYVLDSTSPAIIAASGTYRLDVSVAQFGTPCVASGCLTDTAISLTPIGSGQTLSPYTFVANPAGSSSANSGLASGSSSSGRRRLLGGVRQPDLVLAAGVPTSLSIQLRDGLGNPQAPKDGRKLDILSVSVGLLATVNGKVPSGEYPCIWSPQPRGVPALFAVPGCSAVWSGFDFNHPKSSPGPSFSALNLTTVNQFSTGTFTVSLTPDGQLPAVPLGVYYMLQIQLNSADITGSPFAVQVVPGALYPQNFLVSSSFFANQTAGAPVVYQIYSQDAYGMFTSPCSLLLAHFHFWACFACGLDLQIANDRARRGQWLGLGHGEEGKTEDTLQNSRYRQQPDHVALRQ